MQESDKELVEKCLSGNRNAFGELVTRYQGAVVGLAYHLTGSFEDARDLAQEAFIRAYVKLSDLQDRAKFASWLRRITFSVCMNWLKVYKHDRFFLSEREYDESIYQIPDPSASPLEIAERSELRESVLQAIRNLPETYQLPLILFHLDGLSYEKVADFLDAPVSTIKWRLHQARKALKKEMIPMVAEVFAEHKPDRKFMEETMEKISVLIAESKSDVGKVFKAILEGKGFDVYVAEDDSKALKILNQRDFQVVLIGSDKDIDCLILAEQIIQEHPDMKVIISTGYGTVEQAVAAMKLGAFDYIERPLNLNLLLLKIQRAAGINATDQNKRSCHKCGRKMEDDWKYCPYDGISIDH